jgi:hypothetical protein
MESTILRLIQTAQIKARHAQGLAVCYRRGHHLDGSTIGHWDDRHRCRDCRVTRNTDRASRWPYNRPWGPKGQW